MKISRIKYHDPAAAEQLSSSLQRTGFCILEDAPIDDWLIQQVYQSWQEWFHQSQSLKNIYKIPKDSIGGYASKQEIAKNAQTHDLKEIFDHYKHTPTPKELEPKTKELFQCLNAIGTTCAQWVHQGIPESISSKWKKSLHELIDDKNRSVLRIAYYPGLTGQEPPSAQRASAHEDINMLTIQPAPTSEGLQARDISGQWHDIPLKPNQLIIKAGEMLSEFTEKYIQATSHRVITPVPVRGKLSRIATPYFLQFESATNFPENRTSDQLLEQRLKEVHLMDSKASLVRC